MTNDEAIARAAIAHLQTTYNAKGDHGKFDEMMTVFAPDAVFEVPGERHEGVAAIEAYMRGVLANATLAPGKSSPARHNLTTRQVEFISPEEATGISLFLLIRDGEIVQTGVYFDRYALVNGEWKMSYRRVKMEVDRV
ncbi:MAG: nuclear transport factor 2 family protein [Alphaproteobacteria bacterium]|nr:nuclear transport factor 2 family protein [Alphaproteobacteria bacterium]